MEVTRGLPVDFAGRTVPKLTRGRGEDQTVPYTGAMSFCHRKGDGGGDVSRSGILSQRLALHDEMAKALALCGENDVEFQAECIAIDPPDDGAVDSQRPGKIGQED